MRVWLGLAALGVTVAMATVSVQTVQAIRANGGFGPHVDTEPLPDDSNDLITPVEIRIQRREARLMTTTDSAEKDRLKEQLAGLYKQLSRKSETMGRLAHAEAALQTASTYDPQNPIYPAGLAGLYEDAAQRQKAPIQAAPLMSSASESWESAAHLSREVNMRTSYVERAAVAHIRAARLFYTGGDPRLARVHLDQAKAVEPLDPEIGSDIREVERMISH